MIPGADGGTVKDTQGADRGNSLSAVGFRIKTGQRLIFNREQCSRPTLGATAPRAQQQRD